MYSPQSRRFTRSIDVRTDADRAAVGRVLRGVVEQIHQHLLEGGGIGTHAEQRRRHLHRKREPVLRERLAEGVGRLADQGREIDDLELVHPLTLLELRELQHPLDERQVLTFERIATDVLPRMRVPEEDQVPAAALPDAFAGN